MKREANFNTKFNHWLKHVYKKTAVFELKQTRTNSLAFSLVKPHQIDALLNAKHNVLVWKIPDVGYQNPFDCLSLTGVLSFVVIKYPDCFCLIDIDVFVNERANCGRKSLTSERAKEIAYHVNI